MPEKTRSEERCDEPNAGREQIFQDRGHAIDVQLAGHCRVEFARFHRTTADAVQDRAKAVAVEEEAKGRAILDVEGQHAVAGQLPGLRRPEADDLARILSLKIMKRIVAGDAGGAGNQQGQTARK